MKFIKICLLLICSTYLIGCGQVGAIDYPSDNNFSSLNATGGKLAEVTTPKVIRKLNHKLEKYNPKVEIVVPQAKQTFNITDVAVQLKVEDLPIFKDDQLKLGNHLNLVLDNEPIKQIYDLEQPILLENLTPGTHTIRVFAARPWEESFKNESAYAQKTFNVLTETTSNSPDQNSPLLTYNSPTGTYGAEPFLLDFYLTNAPLHKVAQGDANLKDWRIRATVNGDSFLLENWQAVYLTGLNKGENWIQLELLDDAGNNIENAFNNTVRVINYDPEYKDTQSKLFTDKISLAEAESIVEQKYYIQPVGEPEIIEPTQKDIVEEVEPAIRDKTIESKEEKVNIDLQVPTLDLKEQDSISESDSKLDGENENENNVDLISKQNPQEIEIDEVASPQVIILPEKVESTESKETIITTENANSSEPIATGELSEPESVEISGNEIAITVPRNEAEITSEEDLEKSVWWKKILVGLRQRLENLVKLLPSEV